MYVHKRGGRHLPRWGCQNRHLRGKAICGNAPETWLEDTEAAVLGSIEEQPLVIPVLETALHEAMSAADAPNDDLAPLRRDLARLESELARLAAAIAAGGPLESLLAALQSGETRRGELRARLRPSGVRPADRAVTRFYRTCAGPWPI